MTNKRYLAIIPARGGSKRLPGKNVLPLAGKPLISWTIEAAIGCKYLDKIVVSSDRDDILQVAGKYPIELLKRPDYLATDTATSFDVFKHVIEIYDGYEYVVLLQPTSPLRTSVHINEAIELLEEKKANAVISVSEVEHNPLWCNTLPSDGSLASFLGDDVINKRSQDLEKFYRLNGAIYVCAIDKLLKEETFFIKNRSYAYIMSMGCSVDIDTVTDFKWAEFLVV